MSNKWGTQPSYVLVIIIIVVVVVVVILIAFCHPTMCTMGINVGGS